MDIKTVLSSVSASIVFGILSGYVYVSGEVRAIESKQKGLIERQARQDERQQKAIESVTQDLRELRNGQTEILRYLRSR